MEKKKTVNLWVSIAALIMFAWWTVLVLFVDVKMIGPKNSTVGFATINGYIHNLLGVNMLLYFITDWLGLVPIGVAFGFSVFGLAQLIKRKSLKKVDKDILLLGGFYIIVMGVYILFELLTVNHRPVLINGYLEKSYPSSTTMLVLCVMLTAKMQLNSRIKRQKVKRWMTVIIIVFVCFMVIGRLLSGVHWFTDIVGGALVSAGLVLMYCFLTQKISKNRHRGGKKKRQEQVLPKK